MTGSPSPSVADPAAADPAVGGVRWCLALLDGLLAGGVRDLVLSPGSRSTPVILAAQQRPGLTLTPILDERSAAFYALGLARAQGRPAALLATSGSAPAHWYPAVMEASEFGIPLILLSADRPPELRGWGANQTTDQTRLFGTQVREFHDPGAPLDSPAARAALTALGRRAAAVSQGRRPGPVHINLPLREPLVPRGSGAADAVGVDLPPPGDRPPDRLSIAAIPAALRERLHGRGLIYCGPDIDRPGFAAAAQRCALALGVPLLADPLSEVRFGPVPAAAPQGHSPRITRYKTLARNPAAAQALRPDWILRFGRAPISKTVLEWLPGITLILVDPAEHWSDPSHDLARERSLHLAVDPGALCDALAADPPGRADAGWLARWVQAEQRLAVLAADYLAQAPWCEAQLITDLVAALPAGDGLLCANSLPIRQFETWSGTRAAPLRVFGNRGLSGIDGQLSTLAGLNAGGVPTTGLLGDLSFLHDLSGLLLATRLDRPCIVLNNGGGRIFDYLPQYGLPDFERLWRTPRPVDLGALARTFGLHHQRVSDAAGWQEALASGLSGRGGQLIEVMIDADRSRETHLAFRQRIAEADLLG
ncbi:MAG: 2-succinyl-5-enolpyruvyl-6-hydroxy-3-cyclohexene-1-carboxylic-acid synthase [Lamprocystis purpurea]|nr:2-succinyl-5-enolpyruvyl-6-hydroxy-3-cyclohexene-1-carboxylic-acid synthase [Lamprocystis purpurea]